MELPLFGKGVFQSKAQHKKKKRDGTPGPGGIIEPLDPALPEADELNFSVFGVNRFPVHLNLLGLYFLFLATQGF